MMQMFNPVALTQGNAKIIQECMNNGKNWWSQFFLNKCRIIIDVLSHLAADITDMCARAFAMFQCVYEQNMAAFGWRWIDINSINCNYFHKEHQI